MPRELLFSWTRKDFRVDTFCAGGPGGQHQNKTETGVRITHVESGLASESRVHKSQGQNKKAAFRKLAEKLKKLYVPKVVRERYPSEERIRTYHEPRGLVMDHRIGESYSIERVLDGRDLERIIKNVLTQAYDRELER